MVTGKNQRTKSRKQELQDNGSGRSRLSLPPSLLLQDEIDMEWPHSLLAMWASVEKQTPSTIFGTEEEPAQKNQHVANFQTSED